MKKTRSSIHTILSVLTSIFELSKPDHKKEVTFESNLLEIKSLKLLPTHTGSDKGEELHESRTNNPRLDIAEVDIANISRSDPTPPPYENLSREIVRLVGALPENGIPGLGPKREKPLSTFGMLIRAGRYRAHLSLAEAAQRGEMSEDELAKLEFGLASLEVVTSHLPQLARMLKGDPAQLSKQLAQLLTRESDVKSRC